MTIPIQAACLFRLQLAKASRLPAQSYTSDAILPASSSASVI